MSQLPPGVIFVFGSNLAGRHGKGAALTARQQYGAIYGLGAGFQGQSYAIPTKDYDLRTLGVESIKTYVEGFLFFARAHPEMKFFVTRIGCGLAGYSDHQIAPMFKAAPNNCELPMGWRTFSLFLDRKGTPTAFAFEVCRQVEEKNLETQREIEALLADVSPQPLDSQQLDAASKR